MRKFRSKLKKPNLSLLILKTIFDLGAATIDAFFPAKYPQARAWRRILGMDKSYRFSKQTFSTILWRLQKQGLVSRKSGRWHVSDKALKLLHGVNFAPNAGLPPEDGLIRIVIFDIPERDRKKRHWLRSELVLSGYKMLQKSVWIGYRPLPADFLDGIEYMNLRHCIHVFGVNKKGTIDEI